MGPLFQHRRRLFHLGQLGAALALGAAYLAVARLLDQTAAAAGAGAAEVGRAVAGAPLVSRTLLAQLARPAGRVALEPLVEDLRVRLILDLVGALLLVFVRVCDRDRAERKGREEETGAPPLPQHIYLVFTGDGHTPRQ